MKPFTTTYTGTRFEITDPKPEQVNIMDIARALSHQCRYNGHIVKFYSVAEHCVRVSRLLPHEFKLWGLLHDAAEAYVGDLTRPIRQLVPDFDKVEDMALKAVCKRFGLRLPVPDEVWVADDAMLVAERRDLLVGNGDRWSYTADPSSVSAITPMTSDEAMMRFLQEFNVLTEGRENGKVHTYGVPYPRPDDYVRCKKAVKIPARLQATV